MERAQVADNFRTTPMTRPATALPAVAAILVGGFLLWGAGFAHSDILHDAAHDSRHSFAFPCH